MRKNARESVFKILFSAIFNAESDKSFRYFIYNEDKLNEQDVEFAENEPVSIGDGVTWNYEDYLRVVGNIYVFKNDKEVKFESKQTDTGVRITYADGSTAGSELVMRWSNHWHMEVVDEKKTKIIKTVGISESCEITKIETLKERSATYTEVKQEVNKTTRRRRSSGAKKTTAEETVAEETQAAE